MKVSALALVFAGIVAFAGCAGGKAAVNAPCGGDDDCASGRCHQGVCVAEVLQPRGGSCGGIGECKSFACVSGLCAAGQQLDGTPRLYAEQCKSGKCTAGLCGEGAGGGGGGQGSELLQVQPEHVRAVLLGRAVPRVSLTADC